MNSYPGVYKIVCLFHPHNPYIGETKMKIKTCSKQHEDNVKREQWQKSALALNKKNCGGDVQFKEIKPLKIEHNTFNRKVREALEIQYHQCEPKYGGINIDTGKYVTTKLWMPFFEGLHNLKASMSNSNVSDAEVSIKNTLHGNVSRRNTLQCYINTGKTLIVEICLMMVVTKLHRRFTRNIIVLEENFII